MDEPAEAAPTTIRYNFDRCLLEPANAAFIPFGIGAVIGGTANALFSQAIITASNRAFGPPPGRGRTYWASLARSPEVPYSGSAFLDNRWDARLSMRNAAWPR